MSEASNGLGSPRATGGGDPTVEDTDKAQKWIHQLGETAAAAKLHMSRSSLLRIAGGFTVRRATLLAFRIATGLITEVPQENAADLIGEVVE